MSEPSAIRFHDLRKTYYEGVRRKKQEALRGVSFEVPQGKIFGFLGANGAGKTTAIKIALGLQEPTAGTVEILGQPRGDSAVKRRLGFLPERPYFHLNLTADEFLNFHRSLYGPAPEGKRRPDNANLLRMVGLAEVADRYLRTFSKGMLQRVGLAQALINDPDLIVLDEPMSGLDPVGRREVRNLILDLHAQGKTIFFSTHILSDVENICSQIAFLEKGELNFCGSVEGLLGSRAPEYEVIFRRGPAELWAGLGEVQPFGDAMRLTCANEAEGRRALGALVGRNAEIVSFNRVQKSLEDVLFGVKR